MFKADRFLLILGSVFLLCGLLLPFADRLLGFDMYDGVDIYSKLILFFGFVIYAISLIVKKINSFQEKQEKKSKGVVEESNSVFNQILLTLICLVLIVWFIIWFLDDFNYGL